MNIENITKKIIDDAASERDAIINEAKNQAEEILANAKVKAEEIEARAESRGKQEHEKQLASKKAVAVIDGRNLTLEKKQDVINECFERAVSELQNMPEGEYLAYLKGCGEKAGVSEGEIVLNKRDREAYGEKLVEALNQSGDNKLVLSDETRDIAGGLMIKVGRTYVNVSVDAVLEELHDELTVECAKVLFPGQER